MSFDMNSLFTNILLDETIDICTDVLCRGPIMPPSFLEVIFVELMKMATNLSPSSSTITCTDTSMVLRWVLLWDLLWLTSSSVSTRDNYLTRSQSLIVISVALTIRLHRFLQIMKRGISFNT